MKNRILLLCLFSCKVVFGQKVDILKQSGFQHEYLVKTMDYIEDTRDTSKLKYIATLRIKGNTYHYPANVIRWLIPLQTSAKKMGADAFCLNEYSEKDSIATLTINVYFAGVNALKANKQKAIKNTICLFSEMDIPKDSAYFFLNKSKVFFNRRENYIISASLNTIYNIALSDNISTNLPVKFKKERKARYFIVPENKTPTTGRKSKRNPSKNPSGEVLLIPLAGLVGYAGYELIKNVGDNKMIELKYRDGRFMSDVFK